jgi:cell division septal protein FtsQ
MANTGNPAEKPTAEKRKVVRKVRLSMTKLMLRWAYWLIILSVIGVIGFVIFEAAWIWYSNTRS